MASSYDIPDSTDWLNTPLSSFEPLEAALRCQVCKEFYDTPMMTVCSHTFCSLCIRRCITNDGKCPACKKDNQTDKLVPNWLVGEIVERFVKARPAALQLAKNANEAAKEGRGTNKRKLDETDLEEEAPRRETRSRTTRSQTRAAGLVADDPVEIADSEDDEYVPDGMVKCPICQTPMKEEFVYSHLDKCTGKPPPTGRSTRSRPNNTFRDQRNLPKEPSPAPAKLPQLNYALLTETRLRQKLSALGIPSWGNKKLLERRHIEWLNLWNSNYDSKNPKSKSQLLKELDIWERTQGGHAMNGEAKVMKKDFDGDAWVEDNKDQFSALIANARRKVERAKEEAEKKKDEQPESSSGNVEASNGQPEHEVEVNPPHEPPEPLLKVETTYEDSPSLEKAFHRLDSDIPSSSPQNQTAQPPPPPSTTQDAQPDIPHPYENNDAALESVREKVAIANGERAELPLRVEASTTLGPEGLQNPLAEPMRKVPMFAVPADPVVEVEEPRAK